jgi:uncharacterized phage infection (PIP) family protein YhgE
VVPIVISLAVLTALAGLYLGGILNPTTTVRHFPIAVVNEDACPTGGQIVDGLMSGLDRNKFDVRVLSAADAQHQLHRAGLRRGRYRRTSLRSCSRSRRVHRSRVRRVGR